MGIIVELPLSYIMDE